jgi:hypothetical protein
MSIRTTVTLDEDVLERVKEESRLRSASFRQTLNDLLRTAFASRHIQQQQRPKFSVRPFDMGFRQDLNYDDIGGLIEYLEGPYHR